MGLSDNQEGTPSYNCRTGMAEQGEQHTLTEEEKFKNKYGALPSRKHLVEKQRGNKDRKYFDSADYNLGLKDKEEVGHLASAVNAKPGARPPEGFSGSGKPEGIE